MSARVKAEGDTWRAELAEDGQDLVVVFFCTTTDQRPYRVVQVGSDRDGLDLESISEESLRALFDASCSLGVPKEYPKTGS